MKKISKSLARSFSLTRRLGTKVQMAGKTMYLPNRKVPRVVQKLTLAQIAAIPKDRYSVKVIGPIEPSQVTSATQNHCMLLSSHRANRVRLRYHARLSRTTSLNASKVQTKREKLSAQTDSTKEYTAIIELLSQVRQQVDCIYIDNRKLRRNQKDAPPEDSGIFFPPIDECKLSDCIRQIINQFFGSGDKGRIYGRIIKLVEFCLLMFCYFTRIKILKNKALKPFSDYLAAKVFTDESKFTARTFNNYANDPGFEKVKEGFTNPEKLKINFNHHPEPTGTLQDVFHEIGWNFHHSPYFCELRKQKKNINDFQI